MASDRGVGGEGASALYTDYIDNVDDVASPSLSPAAAVFQPTSQSQSDPNTAK